MLFKFQWLEVLQLIARRVGWVVPWPEIRPSATTLSKGWSVNSASSGGRGVEGLWVSLFSSIFFCICQILWIEPMLLLWFRTILLKNRFVICRVTFRDKFRRIASISGIRCSCPHNCICQKKYYLFISAVFSKP